MEIDITPYKNEFIELLRSTKRNGMEEVLEDLEENGFYTAPASAGHRACLNVMPNRRLFYAKVLLFCGKQKWSFKLRVEACCEMSLQYLNLPRKSAEILG